jgi:hypothetical protein
MPRSVRLFTNSRPSARRPSTGMPSQNEYACVAGSSVSQSSTAVQWTSGGQGPLGLEALGT